jgi:hypothetical protein
MIDKRNEFLTKLANLLDEYNADIEFICSECSDTSGLYYDRIIISERKTEEIILDTFDEWNLSSNVIKKNM